MIFIESTSFTEDVEKLLDDTEYANLQRFLSYYPHAGVLIRDTGGLRKPRWKSSGRGKRGGVRLIYYFALSQSEIRMLMIYRKGVKDDLSVRERTTLRAINEHWDK